MKQYDLVLYWPSPTTRCSKEIRASIRTKAIIIEIQCDVNINSLLGEGFFILVDLESEILCVAELVHVSRSQQLGMQHLHDKVDQRLTIHPIND